MEQKNDLQLFRLRSSGAIIADGYRLYMGNFRRLFRSSWLMAIVYAVSVSLFTSLYLSVIPTVALIQYTQSAPAMASGLAVLGLLILLASLLHVLAACGMMSYGFSAMSEHQSTGAISGPAKWYGRLSMKMLLRTMAALLLMLLIMFLAEAIVILAAIATFKMLGQTAGLLLLGVLELLLIVAIVPMAYTTMKYLLTPKASFFPTLAAAYGTGVRHWGGIFVVILITAIITLLLSFATELPASILGMANLSSQTGVLMGDPAGMPKYMGWMTSVVFCIAGFIQAYIQLASIFPLYYLFGSIEAQESERNQLNKTL